jgi:hypothetical protein
MKIANVISNLKTYLEALTWTSDSGAGTTKLNAVYTYPNWVHDEGYPFAVIQDDGTAGESLDNMTIQAETEIIITVCVNWAIIDQSDEDLQREEGALRIREATDALKVSLLKLSTESTLGVDFVLNPSWGEVELDSDNNLLKRNITLVVKETINRNG